MNPHVGEMRLFADAAEHEQLRRIESTPAEDDLATSLLCEIADALFWASAFLFWTRLIKMVPQRTLHADRAGHYFSALFLEKHARHVRSSLDDELVRMLPGSGQQELAYAEAAARSGLALVVWGRSTLRPDGDYTDALWSGGAL